MKNLLKSGEKLKGWPCEKSYAGYIISYDFRWIEEAVQCWPKDWLTPESIERRLPLCINYYYDFPGSTTHNYPTTHLGEQIPDYDEYLKQKRSYIKKLLKKKGVG